MIGETGDAPDDRSGDAERDRLEARRTAEIAHERGEQIRERREGGGGVSEEVDAARAWARARSNTPSSVLVPPTSPARIIWARLDYSEACVTTSGSAVSKRNVLERYRFLRDDHLRYMAKWGLIRPVRSGGDTQYAFPDFALLRQADAELAEGVAVPGRASQSAGAAERGSSRSTSASTRRWPRCCSLTRKLPPPMAALMEAVPPEEPSSAERYFQEASLLDDGDPENVVPALRAYRRALEIDPYLVPALINLANLHYSRDDVVEAQALYERAIALEPDVFEAHFNLGNIFHDLARYIEAQACYREALRLNPTYAEAHFYLAVTLEKNGRSQEARLHWRAYQQLSPTGEWVHLAKEFSEDPKA